MLPLKKPGPGVQCTHRVFAISYKELVPCQNDHSDNRDESGNRADHYATTPCNSSGNYPPE